jgi:hypothetical protein
MTSSFAAFRRLIRRQPTTPLPPKSQQAVQAICVVRSPKSLIAPRDQKLCFQGFAGHQIEMFGKASRAVHLTLFDFLNFLRHRYITVFLL